jgi:hypothetical protein
MVRRKKEENLKMKLKKEQGILLKEEVTLSRRK